MTKISWIASRLYLILILFISPIAVLAQTTLVVKVTVISSPSCVINDNKTIDVDFGTVIAPQINGVNYTKEVNYSLECKNHKSNSMRMTILGNSSSFDTGALKTNIADLGVSLKSDGVKVKINEWLKFTYPNKPKLEAVLVKKNNSKLSGGKFQASATLLVAYQ
ncbi:TPA: fimbrial protein [Providencia alcalifaciens]